MVRISGALVVCLVLLGACDKLDKKKAAERPAGAAVTSTAQPAGIPVATAGSKTSASPHGSVSDGSLSGVVLETMDAGKYTYVRVESTGGKQWAAVPKAKIAVGQHVSVRHPMLMRNFKSNTLKRTFAQIYFGTLGSGKSAAVSRDDIVRAHQGIVRKNEPVKLGQPIEKAKDGKTVAELYQQRAALSGKTVVVRGKVVKVNNGIMGRNWAHLQDGSRNGKGGFDLTITTKERLKVGQVVEVSGTVGVDRDFGAGYRYPVILEQATVR